MGTGGTTAFVLGWFQTRIDGRRADPSALATGAYWRWQGQAVRLYGRQDLLVLEGARGIDALRARAGRAVRRRLGTVAADLGEARPTALPEDFAVTDGQAVWPGHVILRADAPPLLLFADGLPPADRDLVVAWAVEPDSVAPPAWAEAEGLICFTPGTMIATPTGERPVEALRPGDPVLTRDSGAQPVVWTGRRRIGGGLLYALPRLRPVCLRAAGPGLVAPTRPLLLSPQHLVLLQGMAARDLFGEREVLVAANRLPPACATVDHVQTEVTYIHFALPAHHIVRANGLPVETFHPARAAPGTLDAAQEAALSAALPALDDGPWAFGPTARRVLGSADTEILLHGLWR